MTKFVVRENQLSDGSSTFDVIAIGENGEELLILSPRTEYAARLCAEDMSIALSRFADA